MCYPYLIPCKIIEKLENFRFFEAISQSGSDLKILDALCPVRIRLTINSPDQILGFGIWHSAVLSGVLFQSIQSCGITHDNYRNLSQRHGPKLQCTFAFRMPQIPSSLAQLNMILRSRKTMYAGVAKTKFIFGRRTAC